jgi:AmiR/NasT family two-component response regulator
MLPSPPWQVAVADDERMDISIVSKAVTEEGHQLVITCRNGESLIEECTKTPHLDLIITDIEMRGRLNGFAAADRILRSRSEPVPFLFITGRGNEAAFASFKDIRNSHRFSTVCLFINKPLDIIALKTNIYAAVAQFYDMREVLAEQAARDVVRHAKDILMSDTGMEEEQAHRALQQASARQGQSKHVVAEKIIAGDQQTLAHIRQIITNNNLVEQALAIFQRRGKMSRANAETALRSQAKAEKKSSVELAKIIIAVQGALPPSTP